jgi:ribonucleotide monophosphatase NagD (HAD superfamily)
MYYFLFIFLFKMLQILGLEICADIMVGDGMIRGISGGQKKRVTTGILFIRTGMSKQRQSLILIHRHCKQF